MKTPKFPKTPLQTPSVNHFVCMFLMAFAMSDADMSTVWASEPTFPIAVITSSDWHSDIETVASSYKTYKLAVEKNRPDLADQMLDAIGYLPNVMIFGCTTRDASAKNACEILQKSVESLQNTNGASTNASVQTLESYRSKAQSQIDAIDALKRAKQYLQDAMVARMKLLMLSAYIYKELPPSNALRERRAEVESENNLQLKQMWSRPECRDAMRQSWKNLMKEAYFLNLPEMPFPIDDTIHTPGSDSGMEAP